MKPEFLTQDPWTLLRHYTDARIALGRAGSSLPTAAVLDLALAHARARDAMLSELDADALSRDLIGLGRGLAHAESRCKDKGEYLRRPDLGRRLSELSRRELSAMSPSRGCDLAIVVADGLSSKAVEHQALSLLRAFLPLVADLELAPICLATRARVALGDEIGSLLRARAVIILIGERPGLSSSNSLGAYLTYAPVVGTTDEKRNCVSNIRPAGLGMEQAAARLDYLLRESLRRCLSGIELKDERETAAPEPLRALSTN